MVGRIAVFMCLCVLGVCQSALAGEPGARVIVLAGGKDAAAATAAIARLKDNPMLRRLELAEGYPRVVDSSTVAGLNPGFQIAVAGFCPEKGRQANLARDVLALEFPGAYLRTVTGVPDTSCPKIVPAVCESRSRKYLEVETQAYPPASSLRWRTARVNMDGRWPKTSRFDSLFVDLLQGGACLGSTRLLGEMESPEWEFFMEWRVVKRLDLPGRSWLVLFNGGGSGSSASILGWACGELRLLLELEGGIDAEQLEIEAVAGSDPPAFKLSGVEAGGGLYVLDGCKLVKREPVAGPR